MKSQLQLFDTKQITIGDIVISKYTGVKIKVEKIKELFIIGKEVGFERYPLGHQLRLSDGTKILSYKNIL